MSITVQIRHPTRGITPDNYWVGFIAYYKANSDKGPVIRLSAVEINQLNLGLAEERRRNGGFEFPLALYKHQELEEEENGRKTVISRLYAKILSPEQAFATLKDIYRIDLLIAKKEGTLSDLGEPTTLALYRDDAKAAYATVQLDERWWQYQAVTCTIYETANGSNLSRVIEPELKPAPAFKSTVASFIEVCEAAVLHAQASKRARAAAVITAPAPAPVPTPLVPPSPAKPASEVLPDSTRTTEVVKLKSSIAQPTLRGSINGAVEKPKPSSKTPWWVAVVMGAVLAMWQVNKPTTEVKTATAPLKNAPTVAVQSTTIERPTTPAQTPAIAASAEQPAIASSSDSPSASSIAPTAPQVEAGALVVPSGNSTSSREDLYKFGFDEHLTVVKKILVASRELNRTNFDLQADWLKTNRPPATAWPEADSKLRREFNERIATMVNHGKTVGDTAELKSSVALSESFLTSHFGYSTAHLNLSIAQSSLGNGKSALPSAFHTIVFNPDGVNGWVALGLALARSGDSPGATEAFCAALRKSKFSEKTLTYFSSVAKGEDMAYPEVTESMKRAVTTACPRAQWD